MGVEHVLLNEETRFGGESSAGIMRNRCAFTSKDMSREWADAFTFSIVFGWSDEDFPEDDAWGEISTYHGWDAEMVAFLKDAHERFLALPDKKEPSA